LSANFFDRRQKSEKTLVSCISISPQTRHPALEPRTKSLLDLAMSGGHIYIPCSNTGTLYISVSCNIRRTRSEVSMRTMAASASSTLNATKTSAKPRSGKTTQRLAARKEAQPHSHDQPRVQTLRTDLEMKMITVHENAPVAIKCVQQRILLSGFGGGELRPAWIR
jgi:hypothetical protein